MLANIGSIIILLVVLAYKMNNKHLYTNHKYQIQVTLKDKQLFMKFLNDNSITNFKKVIELNSIIANEVSIFYNINIYNYGVSIVNEQIILKGCNG